MTSPIFEVEATASILADPSAESKLSVNEWIDRVRGELQAAQQFARNNMPVDEEIAWTNAAAICIRRIDTIRRLTS